MNTRDRRLKAATHWPRLTLGLVLGWLCLIGAGLAMPAAHAAEQALQSLHYSTLPGNRVEFTLTLSGQAPKPLIFTVAHPASISIDLPQTRNEVKKRLRSLNVGNIRSVIVAEGQHRTRVVINLSTLSPYTVHTKGNKILLEVGGSQAQAEQAASGTTGASGNPEKIQDVDFRRGENGAGRILVKLSGGNIPVNVQRQGGKVVAVFPHTRVPKHLQQRLNVLDFATPAKYVAVSQQGDAARIAVTPRPQSEFKEVAYQTDGQFTLELQPISEQQKRQQQAKQHKYTGKRISLNFQKVSIRALLQIIADVAGVNIVVSDSVHGDMALRLQNVPYDQALHIILSSNGLGMRRQGNVIMVAPLNELAAQDKAQAEVSQQQTQITPLRSEIIQINYAKATDIAHLLKSNNNSLLSKRGKVSVDTRTNTLLVQDTPAKLAEIHRLINRLDRPVKQVLISSRIVVATNDFTRDLGTQFGVSSKSGSVITSGTTTGTNDILQNGLASALANPTDSFNVNVPAASPAGSAAMAILGSHYLVDLELSAMQAEGKGKVISTPRVITGDSQEASIEQGVEIPYQRASSSGATSTQFKKAVLSLDVTPQITPDGRIIMDLKIRDDSKGQNVQSATGGQVPAINTRRVHTQVLVNNGDTVVLGGIYQQTINQTVTKVPFLGDIPLLGNLFRDQQNENDKSELLVFVTPKIIHQDMNSNGS